MNEFKSTPGLSSSAPLNMNRDIHCKRADDSEPRVSLGTRYVSCLIFDIQNVVKKLMRECSSSSIPEFYN